MADDATPQDEQETTPAVEETAAEAAPATDAAAPAAEVEETPAAAAPAEEPAAAEAAAPAADAPSQEPTAAAPDAPATADEAVEEDETDGDETPRVKPAIPGMDLAPDIVPEGVDPLARTEAEEAEEAAAAQEAEDLANETPVVATINLAADARYSATGKRKTAIARVILKPGTGAYIVNGKTLDVFFPRATLQKNIRQPLEAVGYDDRMDVVASLVGGGVSAQAGALRHGISRALLEADPNLRGELKRRGFLTRDSRAKERKKAGLKKARKKPQFSKR
ncbi:MAG: rpsI [Solirubrobacterales bacterium]|nr:rpsI [Solirubrobacterales bacterium]